LPSRPCNHWRKLVLLHGTWDGYLDGVVGTVAALKKDTNARIVVLSSVPWWKRGLPNEVLRYFMLHESLVPERSNRAEPDGSGAALQQKLVPLGAEFISARKAMCNADGCLRRVGDTAKNISTSDQVHLTEKGSVFLIRLLCARAPNKQIKKGSGFRISSYSTTPFSA
jgi:hypothetical protein